MQEYSYLRIHNSTGETTARFVGETNECVCTLCSSDHAS